MISWLDMAEDPLQGFLVKGGWISALVKLCAWKGCPDTLIKMTLSDSEVCSWKRAKASRA